MDISGMNKKISTVDNMIRSVYCHGNQATETGSTDEDREREREWEREEGRERKRMSEWVYEWEESHCFLKTENCCDSTFNANCLHENKSKF